MLQTLTPVTLDQRLQVQFQVTQEGSWRRRPETALVTRSQSQLTCIAMVVNLPVKTMTQSDVPPSRQHLKADQQRQRGAGKGATVTRALLKCLLPASSLSTKPKCAGNSRVAVELSTVEVMRHQNTILGTSGHRNSTRMVD